MKIALVLFLCTILVGTIGYAEAQTVDIEPAIVELISALRYMSSRMGSNPIVQSAIEEIIGTIQKYSGVNGFRYYPYGIKG
ncbi:AGAP009358-PC [Anopheles gambiae str. PEST]|uniref:AGAP009358-PC n=1 Tax=Anopheles gambiae TaxID=7165 RepID=A7USB9_ANOGA|nr:AGAP009358-PC [Anopheles gambiae str. PEST]